MSAVVDSSVTFSGFEESMTKRPMFTDKHRSEVAFHRFSLLREKNILTDAVILSSDDKRFNVHSVIMAGTSEYFFSNLLNADDHEILDGCPSFDDPCQLSIDSTAVEMIITFCYSGAIEITVDNVEFVLAGATELEIDSLISACCEKLEEMLTVNNCIQLLEIADKHGLMSLKENALAIISEVLPHVSKLPEFFKLNGSQILWLLEQLSSSQGEIFGNLLDSVFEVETLFSSLKDYGDTQSIFRAAFIAGFLMRNKIDPPQTQMEIQEPQTPDSDDLTSQSEIESEKESDKEFEDSEPEEQMPRIHVLGLLKRKTIQFSTFCEIEQKWERSSGQIEITHPIDSFRDAIMIPIDQQIVIFHMQNGSISHAEHLTLETTTLEKITLPCNVECANFALFCHMNDMIYCFARADQQYFHGFDLKSKTWSNGHIDDAMDAKYIVGLKDELFFLGCGYNRTTVRSYHTIQKKWTPRGNLRHEHKETCFKAVVLNGSIFVVMSRFDSEKIYNGTEFLIQRYDDNVEDWFIIKRMYYTHFVDCFNLEVAGNCLYLFYGDGEVQIYNEELNEWHKGPAIDYNVLDIAMCMVAIKSTPTERNNSSMNKSRSFCITSL